MTGTADFFLSLLMLTMFGWLPAALAQLIMLGIRAATGRPRSWWIAASPALAYAVLPVTLGAMFILSWLEG